MQSEKQKLFIEDYELIKFSRGMIKFNKAGYFLELRPKELQVVYHYFMVIL